MPGQVISWSTSNAAIASVSAGGLVTAVTNGTAQIAATAGTATGSFTATVAQAASALQKQSGDAQTGPVATALGTSLVVRVVDALGVAIPNAAVTWAVATGGGSITGGNADAAGLATAAWTPGNTAGTASARATAGSVSATFTATLTAGPAAQITIVAGNNQTGAVGTQVAVKPKARVADQFGNIRVGHTVTWTAGGGGSVVASAGSSTTSTTDATGDATVLSWTMGASAGANSLQASAAAGVTVNFSATAATAGAPTAMAVFVGNNQTSLATFATNTRPAVRVSDANNLPVNGQQVVFTPSAGGNVTGATVVTDMNGIAQVGSWTPGTSAGAATLAAAATGTGLSATFNGTAANAAYNIEIRNIGPAFSPAVQTAFDSAVAFWQRAIYGDLSDAQFTGQTACSGTSVVLNETVDDMLILARFDSLDGPLNVVGSAGDCGWLRSSNGLAIVGQMRFDTADVAFLISNGILDETVRHEMGHVLGFTPARFDLTLGGGFTRDCVDLLTTGSPPSVASQDTHFSCPGARAMFDSIGGTSYTGGLKVPLENCAAGVPASCGPGNYNGHWREATFLNELMTPYLTTTAAMPVSVITIAVFADMGYLVNFAAAETYTRTFTAPAVTRGPVIDLGNDVLVEPRVRVIYDGPPVRSGQRRR
jgi:hypothetical protein